MVSSLQTLNYAERRLAVFFMLADKDVDSVIELAKDEFDEWWVAPIADSPRAMPVAGLVAVCARGDADPRMCRSTTAYRQAREQATENENHRFRLLSYCRCHRGGQPIRLLIDDCKRLQRMIESRNQQELILLRKRARRRLVGVLAELDSADRDILTRCDIEGMTQQAYANQQGLSLPAVNACCGHEPA